MAMNKKEQAEMQALRDKLALVSALRWTEPVARDLPPPSTFNGETSGFEFNSYSGTVLPAWSNSSAHGIGRPSREKGYSASQNSRTLFSTRLLALKALRHEVEIEAAKKLAKIDSEIEAELATTATKENTNE